jgi:hypothetical protein
VRFITPAEYDDAVRRDPLTCPLAATGDFRSGAQLLADAASDRLYVYILLYIYYYTHI